MTHHPSKHTHTSGRLVVVEEDQFQAKALASLLRQEGYVVDVASTGTDALAIVRHQLLPDAVLLDVALPDLSGIELVQRLRAGSEVPIVILTGRRRESDKIAALEAGADDYITKPFSPGELLARIRVQIRHSARRHGVTGDSHGVFTIGALRLDVGLRRVTRGGTVIALSAREFDIVLLLAEAVGCVVSRQHLFAKIWGTDFYGDERALDVYVHTIRDKLEPDPRHPTYLHTVRGVGYRLAEGWSG